MKIDHFIYDFDGTLSDSYPIFLKILLEIIRRQSFIACSKIATQKATVR